MVLDIGGERVALRDQAPLHEWNAEFGAGFSFSDRIGLLNERVYFWPGTDSGPIDYGLRHFARYAKEDCMVLAVPAAALLSVNAATPEFCRYNSGSPRCSGGRKSPRGLSTFTPAGRFDGGPGDVVEVTFSESISLPMDRLVCGPPVMFSTL